MGIRDWKSPFSRRVHAARRCAGPICCFIPANSLTMCHCFAEAVPSVSRHSALLAGKQWHTCCLPFESRERTTVLCQHRVVSKQRWRPARAVPKAFDAQGAHEQPGKNQSEREEITRRSAARGSARPRRRRRRCAPAPARQPLAPARRRLREPPRPLGRAYGRGNDKQSNDRRPKGTASEFGKNSAAAPLPPTHRDGKPLMPRGRAIAHDNIARRGRHDCGRATPL